MSDQTLFQQRIDELDRRLRELLAPDAAVGCERAGDAAIWRSGQARGTLSLLATVSPATLKLILAKQPAGDEQDAVEVAIDEPDAVEMLAEPLAGFFSGRIE